MTKDLHAQLLDKVHDYRMPKAAIELITKNPPLLLVGASASGKSSIMHRIEQISLWRHVITHTTRSPRYGEEKGKNYWFVDDQEMLNLLNKDEMIEAKAVHGDTVYGTSVGAYKTIIKGGFQPALVIEVQGVGEITKHLPGLRPVFILPPSFEEWMQRLDKRGLMSHVERKKRLESARKEMEVALHSPYYRLVVNHDLLAATTEILRATPDPTAQLRNKELLQQLINRINSY